MIAQTGLEGDLRAAIGQLGLASQRLLVAVSGGIDSVVLLHGLVRIGRYEGLELAVAHIDHGLRGAESEADRHFVSCVAAALDVPFAAESIDCGETQRAASSSRERPTVQEAARVARYAALEKLRVRSHAAWIVTAHNADDQAETLMMRLLRGASPETLAGIPARDAGRRLARPLLRVPRATIARYADQNALRWREDSSNASAAYTRNRLRHHWLPALAAEFNPQLLRALSDLAETMAGEREWLHELVAAEASRRFEAIPGGFRIERAGWDERSPALARRLVGWLLIEMGLGRDLSRRHVARVLAFLGANGHCAAAPGRLLELPRGVRLRAAPDAFEIRHGQSASLRPC